LFTGGCRAFEPRGGSHHHNYGRTPFYSFEWPSLQPPHPHRTAAGAGIQTRRSGAFGKTSRRWTVILEHNSTFWHRRTRLRWRWRDARNSWWRQPIPVRPAGSAHPIWAGQSAGRTVCRDRSWAVAIRTRSGVRSGAAGVRPAFRGLATTAKVGRSASRVPDAAAWTVGSRGQGGAAAVRLVPVQGSGRTGRFMGRRGQRLFMTSRRRFGECR